ncbi:MAG: tetratricopeptide repeat protein [Acidobacteria bacterium]|nr:tetratricopeptide repeat protein [Acidobacteriota bacterium]
MSSTGSTNNSTFEFEDYVLRPSERLLLRNGIPVPLKAKVFETLLSLVQNHGRILSKEDLMKLIWSDRYVEENNLSQYIFILRRILGENPQDHRFIVTIPGHGYRFVAKVNEIPESSNGHLHHSALPDEKTKIRSIAILPPAFLDPEQQEEFLGLALADTLITQLSTNKSISVRSTAAVHRYTGSGKDPIVIGQEIKVDAVMSGTIYKVRDRMAVNLQLTSVASQETLWANRFEVSAADFLELQGEIATEVANALAIELEKPETSPGMRMPKSQEIYQKYLKARFLWERRTEASLLEGLECVREIVETEPDFPLAYIGVADSYLLLGEYLYLSPEQSFPFAREAAERSLELDPRIAEGHASMAEYFHYYEKDWAKAEECYQKANRLNPNYASARHWYAWSLMCFGRFDEAREQIELAQAIDPSSMVLSTSRGLPFYFKREYSRAISQFELVLGIQPQLTYARYYLGSALVHAGDPYSAIREFEMLVEEEPLQQAIALLGFSYAEAGRFDSAQGCLRKLDEMELSRYISPYVRAIVHCGLGEIDQALAMLEQAYFEKAPWLVWLRIDPFLTRLYGEPRFEALLDKLHLR